MYLLISLFPRIRYIDKYVDIYVRDHKPICIQIKLYLFQITHQLIHKCPSLLMNELHIFACYTPRLHTQTHL